MTRELADTCLNVTSSVVSTDCPIETSCSTLREPSNSWPELDNVTPVPPVNINGFVTTTPISDGSGTPCPTGDISSSPSINWPLLPTVFTTVVVSVPKTNFFGVINFWVVDLWSKLPFGNKYPLSVTEKFVLSFQYHDLILRSLFEVENYHLQVL